MDIRRSKGVMKSLELNPGGDERTTNLDHKDTLLIDTILFITFGIGRYSLPITFNPIACPEPKR